MQRYARFCRRTVLYYGVGFGDESETGAGPDNEDVFAQSVFILAVRRGLRLRRAAARDAVRAAEHRQPLAARRPFDRHRSARGREPGDVRRHRLLHGLHHRLSGAHLLQHFASSRHRRGRQLLSEPRISGAGHQLSVERRVARRRRRDGALLHQHDPRHRRVVRRRRVLVGVPQHRFGLRSGVRGVGDRAGVHLDLALHQVDQHPRHRGQPLRHRLRRQELHPVHGLHHDAEPSDRRPAGLHRPRRGQQRPLQDLPAGHGGLPRNAEAQVRLPREERALRRRRTG